MPLVVGSDDGVVLFASIPVAQGWIEAIDVEAGVYGPAFDAEGRALAIDLEEPPPTSSGWLDRVRQRVAPQRAQVRIRLVEAEPSHRAELEQLLESALERSLRLARKQVPVDERDDLLTKVRKRYGVIGS